MFDRIVSFFSSSPVEQYESQNGFCPSSIAQIRNIYWLGCLKSVTFDPNPQ